MIDIFNYIQKPKRKLNKHDALEFVDEAIEFKIKCLRYKLNMLALYRPGRDTIARSKIVDDISKLRDIYNGYSSDLKLKLIPKEYLANYLRF